MTSALIALTPNGIYAQKRETPAPQPIRELVVGDDAQALGSIGSATLLPGGQLVLTDLPTKRVLLFSSDGMLVGSGGGEGRAPGQLLSISAMGTQGDSIIWAVDNVQQRVVQWSLPSLEHLATQALERAFPALANIRGLSIRTIGAGGGMVVSGKWTLNRGRPLAGLDSVWHWNQNGKRTLLASTRWDRQAMILAGGQSISTYQPFSDNALFAAAADGSRLFTVLRPAKVGGVVEIQVFTEDNDRSDTTRIRLAQRPLLRRVTDSVIRGYAAGLRASVQYGTTAAAEADVRRGLFIPSHWPPISAIVADRTGSQVWMALQHTTAATVEWVAFDVASKTLTNRFRLSAAETPIAFDRSVFWSKRYTENGEFVLSRWRLP